MSISFAYISLGKSKHSIGMYSHYADVFVSEDHIHLENSISYWQQISLDTVGHTGSQPAQLPYTSSRLPPEGRKL